MLNSLVLSLVSGIHWGSWNISHKDKATTVYPEVGLLDTMAVLFLSFRVTPILCSIVTVPIYVSTNGAKSCLFSTALSTLQFSSVTQSCPTLCDPMDCSKPGFPVHHQLPEFTQTHVRWVSDAIQPSHPLSSPSPPAFSIRVFSNESVLHIRWQTYWSFSFIISPSNECSGLISFMMDWFDLLAPTGLSRVFSDTGVQKHQFFGAQLSSPSNSHIHTWLLEKPKLWPDGPLSAK